MAIRNIDFGSFPDDPSADAIRTAFQKVQENFTELFSGLQDQSVLSINRVPGAGTTVNSPTGNVIISANIAQVRVESTTLNLSAGAGVPGPLAVINQGSTPLIINLPANVNGIANVTLSDTLTAQTVNVNAQINGNTAVFTGNVTAANLTTNTTTSNILVVNSNANIAGNLVVSGNANITSNVNTTNLNATTIFTTTANVTGNINGNIINANFFHGDGSNITNVVSLANTRILNGTSYANITDTNGNLNIVIAGTPTMTVTSSGANISGYATITGNVTAGNLIGVLANGGTSNITIVSATGNVTTAVAGTTRITATSTGANVTGTLGVSANANVLNLGTARVIATGNISGTQIISNIANGTAPLSVDSQTKVANLNADLLDGYDSATLATANTVAVRDSNSSLTANVFIGSGASLTNIPSGNIAGQVANALIAGTVYTNSQPNITSLGTLSSLSVTGDANVGNLNANRVIATGNISGTQLISNIPTGTAPFVVTSTTEVANLNAATASTVTAASQPNITSLGTLSSITVTGNTVSGNVYANSGTVGASLLIGTLTTNAQPNITSLGTLASLTITGNLAAGNANLGNSAIANFFVGDGSLLTNISVGAGSFIEDGNSEVRVDANGNVRITVSGNANILTVTSTGANVNGYANITGNVTAGNVSATTLTGNLTTAAQPNVTSVGTLTGLTVNGISNLGPNSNVKITGGVNNAFLKTDGTGNLIWDTATLIPAQGANTQVIFNDEGSTYGGDANLTFNKTTGALTVGGNLTVGNISGPNNVTSSFFTGTLRTNSQPNITSVGTLTGLNVNGNIVAANITANTGVFTGNGSGLTNLNAGNLSTGTVSSDRLTGTYNISVSGSAGSATTATSATTAGTVTTNAQPNITSIGALSSLIVNGTISAGNVSVPTGTITANLFSGNGANLTNITGSNVTGQVANAIVAGTVYTNSQPNITSVGTLTSLSVTGNANVGNIGATSGVFTNVSGNGSALTAITGANVSGAVAFATTANSVAGANVSGQVANALVAGTVYTAAQPNITSVGTLTSLAVTGNITAGNISTGGVISVTGNANVGNLGTGRVIATGNISGTQIISNIANGTAPLVVTSTTQVANLNAATAGTVTTEAQPNITSLGTLTSLNVSGNVTAPNLIANTGFVIRSVSGSITSAGTVQGNATAITTEINVVSTVASGSGVRLPAAVAGMVVTITNTSANTVNVYPATGASINSLSANIAYQQAPGATLQFIAPTTTQWYTVGATFA